MKYCYECYMNEKNLQYNLKYCENIPKNNYIDLTFPSIYYLKKSPSSVTTQDLRSSHFYEQNQKIDS